MPTNVLGLFARREAAEAAIDRLLRAGFARDRISVAMRHVEAAEALARQAGAGTQGEDAKGDAALAATGGGVVGGLAGLLAGVGALTIPGLGPILAIGPLAAALSSTAAGAAIGATLSGLGGALLGWDVAERHAAALDRGVGQGGILLAVQAEAADAGRARAILRAAGAEQLADERVGPPPGDAAP